MAFQLINALLSKEYFRETLLMWWFVSVAKGVVEHPIFKHEALQTFLSPQLSLVLKQGHSV